MLQICQNIKQARVSKGKEWSQDRMAKALTEALGELVSRSTYRNWEEKTEPTLSIIRTIAQILEVPAWSLLVGVIDYSDAVKKESGPNEVPDKVKSLLNSEIEAIRISLDKIQQAAAGVASIHKDDKRLRKPVQEFPLRTIDSEEKSKSEDNVQKKGK